MQVPGAALALSCLRQLQHTDNDDLQGDDADVEDQLKCHHLAADEPWIPQLHASCRAVPEFVSLCARPRSDGDTL